MTKKSLIAATLCLFVSTLFGQSVGIGTNEPAGSALLEVKSSNQGFLPPRMTSSQRDGISNPATGLMVYCTDCGDNGEMQYFNGSVWTNMIGVIANQQQVKICNQVWMIRNLDVVTYRNGDTIPQVADPVQWEGLTTGAWCWFDNDSATYAATYGRLYNWYAVNDPRGLAPQGWHIPSDAEWTTLTDCLGGEDVAGGKMKAVSSLWASSNVGATNSSGFTGLPGGLINFDGSFNSVGFAACWWSKTQTDSNPTEAWYRYLYYFTPVATRSSYLKSIGLSVRCVKD